MRILTTFAAALAFAGVARAEPTKIAVGYVTASDFTPIFVAKEKGIFAKHDLDVDAKRIPIIVNIPPAIIAGDLQIGAATMPVLLQAADGGLDMQLVSGGARHVASRSKIGLMIRSGLKVEKPEDLKGKKIGVAGFNSTMDVFLRKWLRVKGLGDNDVIRVEANFPQMPDLLKSGTIDGATITDPMRTIAINQGVGYVFSDYFAELLPDVLMIGYISSSDWAKKNAAAIKNFRASLDEAADWMLANKADIAPIEQKYLGFTSNSISDLSTLVKPDDLDPYIALGKEFNLYRTQFDPAKLIFK